MPVTLDQRSGDLAWCAREVVRTWGRGVLLVSITAPGGDVLPLGSDGRCRYDALAQWSSDLVPRWNKLRSRCVDRACKRRNRTPILITRYDVQKRGAPHIHLVVQRTEVGLTFAYYVKAFAAEYGFGFVDVSDVTAAEPVAVAHYAAGYVARNLSGEAYGSSLLPKRLLHISREWSYKAGADMQVARAKRRLWVFANVTRDVGMPPRMLYDDVFASKVHYHSRVSRHGLDKVRVSVVDWFAEYEKRKGGVTDAEGKVHRDRLRREDGNAGGSRSGEDVPQQESLLGPGEWWRHSDESRGRGRRA